MAWTKKSKKVKADSPFEAATLADQGIYSFWKRIYELESSRVKNWNLDPAIEAELKKVAETAISDLLSKNGLSGSTDGGQGNLI